VRDWVRFMLEEIRRKEAEAEEARAERRRRAEEGIADPGPEVDERPPAGDTPPRPDE
jgi:hypothetical protein